MKKLVRQILSYVLVAIVASASTYAFLLLQPTFSTGSDMRKENTTLVRVIPLVGNLSEVSGDEYEIGMSYIEIEHKHLDVITVPKGRVVALNLTFVLETKPPLQGVIAPSMFDTLMMFGGMFDSSGDGDMEGLAFLMMGILEYFGTPDVQVVVKRMPPDCGIGVGLQIYDYNKFNVTIVFTGGSEDWEVYYPVIKINRLLLVTEAYTEVYETTIIPYTIPQVNLHVTVTEYTP